MKTSKTLIKRIVAIFMILGMLIPYVPANVFAAEEEELDFLEVSAVWESTSTDTIDGYTGSAYSINYNLKANKIESGLRNVMVTIQNDDTVTPKATITASSTVGKITNAGNYTQVDYGTINKGTSLGGNVSVKFRDSEELYEKKIRMTISGYYLDEAGNEVQFSREKVLTANVTPATKTTEFTSVIRMQTNNEDVPLESSITHNTIGSANAWYATTVTATYPIHVTSEELTQNLTLDVTINRITDKESKTSTGYSIDWNGLNEDLGMPEVIENENESVTFRFTKGTESDTYTEGNTFNIDKDYNVKITYTIPNTSAENAVESSTKVTLDATLESSGFKIVKEYKKADVITKEQKKTSISKSNNTTLRNYTPGGHDWAHTVLNVRGSSYITEEKMDEFVEDRKIDLDYRISRDSYGGYGRVNGTLNFMQPELKYLSDDNEVKTIKLNTNQMKLSKISASSYYDNVKLITDSEIIADINSNRGRDYDINAFSDIEYIEFEDGVKNVQGSINEYSIYVKEITPITFTYELDADELGLSDSEIKNILSIGVDYLAGGKWLYGGNEACYYNINSAGYKHSLITCDFGSDFDYTKGELKQEKSFKIRMNKFADDKLTVYNENPIFYIKLPKDFEYDEIDYSLTENDYNIYIDEDNVDWIELNGEEYIVIPLIGTYNSKKMGEVDLEISYERTLVNQNAEATQEIDVYMITDNESYYYASTNNGMSRVDGSIPSSIFKESESFTIKSGNKMQAISECDTETAVCTTMGENIKAGIISNPLKVRSNKDVKIISRFNVTGYNVEDLAIYSKIPTKNNKSIDNDNELINDTTINQISLENIRDIKVSCTEGASSSAKSIRYKLYYTENEDADFSTTDYTEYTEGADLSNAKMFKLVVEDEVSPDSKIMLEYTMTMPDVAEGSMTATQTAAEYKEVGKTEQDSLTSAGLYIANGNPVGDILVQKTFEGFKAEEIPYGLTSLSGIQFRLKDKEGNIVKDSAGHEIVATTDDKGIAKFTGIEEGTYRLVEDTEFEYYGKISNLVVANVKTGETCSIVAENPIKRGRIVVQKQWEDVQGQYNNAEQVSVKITRKNTKTEGNTTKSIGAIPYTRTMPADENGQIVFEDVPYGEYTVTEETGPEGWVCATGDQNVSVWAETSNATVENRLARNTLKIVKSVPRGETVDGLTFHITGLGLVTYTNEDGEEVDNCTDMTVKIGEEYDESKVSIEKSNNDTVATIEIYNLPLGVYTVEEIDIPELEGYGIEKYTEVKRAINITKDLSETEKPITLNISNNYKYGYIEIHKTAKLKEGETYTDIGDLSSFKVLVTGTSYYGTAINKVISLDENGYGIGSVEIGKYTLKEIGTDGYTTYYGEDSTASTTPVEVEVENGKTVKQSLYNEHTGVGYVRVEKSLEHVEDPQKVVDAGIMFRIVGKNVAGGKVNSTIKIDKIDATKNVAYGVSEAISVGGEYELEEIEETVPDYYEGIEAQEIDLKTEHTSEAPLLIEAVNNRTKGNLEMTTVTVPEGGDLFGIRYRVTPVDINKDGSYETTGAAREVNGSNDPMDASFAKLSDIDSGNYLVEQIEIPDGYTKDMPQIVEVPSYNTGYANFEITKLDEMKTNKVIVEKEVLNEAGEIATDEEIEQAKLKAEESFEVRIKNVDSKKVYYVFTDKEEAGKIVGLEEGTYEIEEVYKPKYLTEGYYIVNGNDIEEKINKNDDGKYTFTIEEHNGKIEDVKLRVKNIINTKFGFGGKDSADNLGQIDVEEGHTEVYSKAIVYVVDEEGNSIPGVKFKLLDAEGKEVAFNDGSYEFEVVTKKITIKGMPVGKYKLVCTNVPSGYLVPEEKEFMVYEDAVQVANIEIQKNIPRGAITLSTMYTNKAGEPKYTSKSSYKVVDKETGELVKFVKTPTGDYKKSNLDSASPIISLKAGEVEVEGLEVGEYEVGLVGVTYGYGIPSPLPTTVNIVENDTQTITTEVENKGVVQVDGGYNYTMYLDKNGDLYVMGYNYNGCYGNGTSSSNGGSAIPIKILLPEGVKIQKFETNSYTTVALDSEGRVWGWGYDGCYSFGNQSSNVYYPLCITDNILYDEYYNKGLRFIDIGSDLKNPYATVLIDNLGRLWTIGRYYSGNGNEGSYDDGTKANCLSEIEGTALNESYQEGVTVKSLAQSRTNGKFGFIDSLGKIWVWGRGNICLGTGNTDDILLPYCLSNNNYELKNIKFVQLSISDGISGAVDEDGNVWMWGDSNSVLPAENTMLSATEPHKVSSEYFGGNKIKEIQVCNDASFVIDENGKVWSWGTNSTYCGSDEDFQGTTPVCISDDEDEQLYGIKASNIDISWDYSSPDHILILDETNKIWGWGNYSNYGEIGTYTGSNITKPRPINIYYDEHLEYNLRFKEVYNTTSYKSFAIDEDGRLWSWGENNNGELGIEASSSGDRYVTIPRQVEIPNNEKVKKISGFINHTEILTESGKLYVAGNNGDGTWGNGRSSYSDRDKMHEITDNLNLKQDVYIVDITSNYNGVIAVDSEGKVYTWGTSTSFIGRDTNTTDPLTPTCISDDGELYGKKVIAVSNSYSYVYALTDEGEVYFWGDGPGSLPRCITEDVDARMIEICEDAAIDENGDLWSHYSMYDEAPSNLMEDVTRPFYKLRIADENYKIVKIYDCHNGTGTLACKDSNGDIWIVDIWNGGSANKVTDKIGYNLPKEIISISELLLVDGDGQVWVYKETYNSYGEAGIGSTERVTSPQCIIGNSKNKLYNVKMKTVYNDQYVSDEKGDLYKFNDTVEKYGIALPEYLEGTLGLKVIDKACEKNYKIAIDENGKLWASHLDREISCFNDTEGYEIYEEFKNDSNLKFEKLYLDSNIIIVIDNYGRLWASDVNSGIYKIKCLSKVSGSDLYKASTQDENFKIIEAGKLKNDGDYYAKSNDGKIFLWGKNEFGELGNGIKAEVENPYCVNNEIENKKIIDYADGGRSISYLCEDGSVYFAGQKVVDGEVFPIICLGICEGAERIVSYGRITAYKTYMVYGNSKIWTFGYDESPYLQSTIRGWSGANTWVPTLISNQVDVYMTNKEGDYGYRCDIIDKEGKIWSICSGTSGILKCLNDLPENAGININAIYLYSCSDTHYIINDIGDVFVLSSGIITLDKDLSIANIVNTIYGSCNKENIQDLFEKICNKTYQNWEEEKLIQKDGEIWKINLQFDSAICINNMAGSEMKDKYITSWSEHKAIDEDGNLYGWETGIGLKDVYPVAPVCITNKEDYCDTQLQSNKKLQNVPTTNKLNGLKVKELVNDNFVVDENNDVWYFPTEGKAIKLCDDSEFYNNLIYGLQFKESMNEDYIITTDNKIWYVGSDYPAYAMDAVPVECEYVYKDMTKLNSYYIAIDKDGKVWTCGSGYLGNGSSKATKLPICLNDVEGTELYKACQNDSTLKIVKIGYSSYNGIIALDSNGKVWTWKEDAPTCLSNIEGTELYQAYQDDDSFKIVDIIDSSTLYDNNNCNWKTRATYGEYNKEDGDYIAIGDYRSYKNGDLYGVKSFQGSRTYTKILTANVQLKNNVNTSSYGYLWYTNGEYYYSKGSKNKSTGNMTYTSKYVGEYNVKQDVILDGDTYYYHKTYVLLDVNGDVYVIGNNDSEYIGTTGSLTENSFKCLNEETSSPLYNKEIVSMKKVANTVFLFDKDGNIYSWGALTSNKATEFTQYDELITKMYGEANNENRMKLIEIIEKQSTIDCKGYNGNVQGQATFYSKFTDGEIYKVILARSYDQDTPTISTTDTYYTNEFIGPKTEIEEVLDNSHVKAKDGTIYKVLEDGTMEIDATFTPEEGVEEIYEDKEIEGVNIVKQTQYKALDDNGNLYVWDRYTGLENYKGKDENVICISSEEYDIDPIYSSGNGWSVIKNY